MGNKNIEIQFLRGYAILITVIAHLSPLAPWSERYLTYFWLGGGVDLFFCVSGYVIARRLLQEKPASFLGMYIPFLIRRAYRLWPAAMFWSVVVIILSISFNKHGSFGLFETNFQMAVAGWFNVANARMVSCLYVDSGGCAINSPLRIYWSLSLEEQFYVLFPLILYFAGGKRLAIFSVALAVLQLFLARAWPSPLWFFRTDAISIGVIIAWLEVSGVAKRIEPVFLLNKTARRSFTVFLLLMLFMVAKKEVVYFYHGLVSVVAGALVLVASYDNNYLVAKGSVLKVVSFVGERSYSIYLTHMVGIVLLREFVVGFYGGIPAEKEWTLFLIVLALALIAAISEFSYRFIEKPFREKGRSKALSFESKIV